jgi:hypothetical protein
MSSSFDLGAGLVPSGLSGALRTPAAVPTVSKAGFLFKVGRKMKIMRKRCVCVCLRVCGYGCVGCGCGCMCAFVCVCIVVVS